MSAIQDAKNMMFVDSSVEQYLRRLGGNYGVPPPQADPFDDDLYRQFIQLLAAQPKAQRRIVYQMLEILFGKQADLIAANRRPWRIFEIQPNVLTVEVPSDLIPTSVPANATYLHGLGGNDGYTAAGSEMVTNGGFETGDFTGWTTANPTGAAPQNLAAFNDSPFGTLIPSTGAGVFNGGARFAVIGNTAGAVANDSYIEQTIVIPNDANGYLLDFIFAPTNRDTPSTSHHFVQITDSAGTTVLATLHNQAWLDSSKAWLHTITNPAAPNLPYDLTPYVGQTIRVRFRQTSPGTGISFFGVDNVSVRQLARELYVHRDEDFTRAAVPLAGLTIYINGVPNTITGVSFNASTKVNTISLLNPPPNVGLTDVKWTVYIPAVFSFPGNYFLPNALHNESEVNGAPVVMFGPGLVDVFKQYMFQLVKAAGVQLDVRLVNPGYVHPTPPPLSLVSITIAP